MAACARLAVSHNVCRACKALTHYALHPHRLFARSPAPAADLPQWNAIVGLRNRLGHDYVNVNLTQVLELAAQERERFVVGFLLGR